MADLFNRALAYPVARLGSHQLAAAGKGTHVVGVCCLFYPNRIQSPICQHIESFRPQDLVEPPTYDSRVCTGDRVTYLSF
jgi:hypothetical protein